MYAAYAASNTVLLIMNVLKKSVKQSELSPSSDILFPFMYFSLYTALKFCLISVMVPVLGVMLLKCIFINYWFSRREPLG